MDVLNVKVDGTIVQSYPEPSVAESAYTLRTVNLNAFANGANHQILFEYIGPSSATGSYVIDDVSVDVCSAAAAPSAKLFDFTGDGKADLSVFTPGTTKWTVQDTTSLGSAPSISSWGASGDKLVPADYDGDGKADIAVYRPGISGQWWIIKSSNNTVIDNGTAGVPPRTGTSGDVPVPSAYIAAPNIP